MEEERSKKFAKTNFHQDQVGAALTHSPLLEGQEKNTFYLHRHDRSQHDKAKNSRHTPPVRWRKRSVHFPTDARACHAHANSTLTSSIIYLCVSWASIEVVILGLFLNQKHQIKPTSPRSCDEASDVLLLANFFFLSPWSKLILVKVRLWGWNCGTERKKTSAKHDATQVYILYRT